MAKDAGGHGSEKRGPLEGGAAHARMVQKLPDARSKMGAVVTRYDREQAWKAGGPQGWPPRNHYNPNALPLMLGAADRVDTDLRRGVAPAVAVNNHFNGSVANRLHKALGTGGVDIDTQRAARFK